MKSFLKFASKFFVTSVCAVALCVSTLAYNPRGAIDYAKGHWGDGKGQCAEFVSDCLIAGDIHFSRSTDAQEGRVAFYPNGQGFYRGCWGLFYDLQYRLDDVEIKVVVTESDGSILWAKNPYLKPGDVLFIRDKNPDVINDTYTHVVLVGDRVGDRVTMYGHNNPRNNEVLHVNPRTERWVCAHFIR